VQGRPKSSASKKNGEEEDSSDFKHHHESELKIELSSEEGCNSKMDHNTTLSCQ
jgi:hypothetical protein